MEMSPGVLAASASALALAVLTGCDRAPEPTPPPVGPYASRSDPPPTLTLTFASFLTTREAFEKRIIPEFQLYWLKTRGHEVVFDQSYAASSVQAKSIVEGLEADVAVLSSEGDLDLLLKNRLIREDWRQAPHGGIVCRSVTVLVVRKGNPHRIVGWPDLARSGLRIFMPDPWTSDGGKWDICAIYGAALRGQAGVAPGDPVAAEELLGRILANVAQFEKDARGSFKLFEGGDGYVAITSESEARRSSMFGHQHEVVIPPSTLRVDNPAAVLDVYAEKHGVEEVARAFLEFLWIPETQNTFAFYGFRPVDEGLSKELASQNLEPPDLWTINDLGGWEWATTQILGPGGAFERASINTVR
jgi:sulfate/thiosulfate-binding protein